ncbi:MAG: thiamine pyrophosphate-dependent enzyme, partial [Chitinophagales bacterium]|nr:thiamine pyrophosphate-dependent enzyme [Chitinophagales bacterium]
MTVAPVKAGNSAGPKSGFQFFSFIFLKNPSVVLMGDSTFYHSGISAISNSLQLNHNITYIILDNDNT